MNGKRIGFGEEIRVIYSVQQHEGAILLLCDRAEVLEFTPTVFELQDDGVQYRENATVEKVLPLIGTEGGNIAAICPARAASHPRGKAEHELTLECWPKASRHFKTEGGWATQTIKGLILFRKYTEEEHHQVFGTTQATQGESCYTCDSHFSLFYRDGQCIGKLVPHSAASKSIKLLHSQRKPLSLETLCNSSGADRSLRRRTFSRHRDLFDALIVVERKSSKSRKDKQMVSLQHKLTVGTPDSLAASK